MRTTDEINNEEQEVKDALRKLENLKSIGQGKIPIQIKNIKYQHSQLQREYNSIANRPIKHNTKINYQIDNK